MRTDINKLLKNHLPLKWYHNSTLKQHQYSETIQEVTHNAIIFLPGTMLDVLVSNTILNEDEPRLVDERFLDIE